MGERGVGEGRIGYKLYLLKKLKLYLKSIVAVYIQRRRSTFQHLQHTSRTKQLTNRYEQDAQNYILRIGSVRMY